MNKIPIAFAFDHHLVFPAKICLSSLLMSANKETFYDIYILHSEEITIETKDFYKLQEHYSNCQITFRSVDKSLFKGCYEIRGITYAAYYRLMIPYIIPEYDKIIYSDIDVIFREDQAKYYEMASLNNCYVAGVNSDYNQEKKEIDSYYTEGYIYSGNIILNSKLIRERDLKEAFLKAASKSHSLQDMEVLNVVCKGHIQRLPLSFCLTPHLENGVFQSPEKISNVFSQLEIEQALLNGTIHYAGPKPWKTMCCLNADVWWSVYRNSLFYEPKVVYSYGFKHFNFLDTLSLWKRMKVLWRFFRYGVKK